MKALRFLLAMGLVFFGGQAWADTLTSADLTTINAPEISGTITLNLGGSSTGFWVVDFGSGNTATFTGDDVLADTGSSSELDFQNANGDSLLIYYDPGTLVYTGNSATATMCTTNYSCDGPMSELLLNGNQTPFYLTDGSIYETFHFSGATPEPSSLALLGTGLVGAGGIVRRRIFA